MAAARVALTALSGVVTGALVVLLAVAHLPARGHGAVEAPVRIDAGLHDRLLPARIALRPAVPHPRPHTPALFVQVRTIRDGTFADSTPVRIVLDGRDPLASRPGAALQRLLVVVHDTRMAQARAALGDTIAQVDEPLAAFEAGLRRRAAADERRLLRSVSALAARLPSPGGRLASIRAVVVAVAPGDADAGRSQVSEAVDPGFSPGLVAAAVGVDPAGPYLIVDTGWTPPAPGVRAWSPRTAGP